MSLLAYWLCAGVSSDTWCMFTVHSVSSDGVLAFKKVLRNFMTRNSLCDTFEITNYV